MKKKLMFFFIFIFKKDKREINDLYIFEYL